jgi:putative endonuclease
MPHRVRGTQVAMPVSRAQHAQNRTSQHRQKLLPGFTNAYGVTRLVYFEEFSSIIEARARERSLKRWRRAWKFDLVDQLNPEWRDLAHEITN